MDTDVLKSYLVKLGFAVDQSQFAQFDQALKRAAGDIQQHTGRIRKTISDFADHWRKVLAPLQQAFSKPTPGGSKSILGQFLGMFGKAGAAEGESSALVKTVAAGGGVLAKFSAVASVAVAVGQTAIKIQTAVIGAFTAVSAAVWGVVERVAMADQKYRLFARRMFITTEQARTLQLAMKSLGATMEEIYWDPELRSQFNALNADRQQNARALGGDYEENMRKVRGVRFELIRIKQNVEDLVRLFAAAILRAFGTDMDGVLCKLRTFNSWFKEHMPQIAEFLARVFTPILKSTGSMFHALADLVKATATAFTNLMALLSGDRSLESKAFDAQKFGSALAKLCSWIENTITFVARLATWIVNFITGIETGLMNVVSWMERATAKLMRFFGVIPAWARSILFPDSGSSSTTSSTAGGGIKDKVIAEAQRQGVDPRVAVAVAEHESGLRQFDKNGNLIAGPGSSARGVFQLLAGTAKQLGVDRTDTDQNIRGGVSYLKELIAKYGDTKTALEAYYAGPGYVDAHRRYSQAVEPRYSQYASSIMARSQQITVDVGGINITQPGATEEQIARATERGIASAMRTQTLRTLPQLSYGYGA